MLGRMKPWGICLPFLLGSCAYAQTAKKVHVEGKQAEELISLLVSGNEDVRQAIKDGGATTVIIHDLQLQRESTFKYDPIDPYYRLDVVHAWGKVQNADKVSTFGDALAMYTLLLSLNLDTDTTVSGSTIEVKRLDCRIQPTLDIDTPARFACDLESVY
jgi:hypothetical protein